MKADDVFEYEPPRAGIRSAGFLCKIINNVNKLTKMRIMYNIIDVRRMHYA